MAYLNNIPQPSDQIASSQPQILGNFSYIQTTMLVDHAWAGMGISPSKDGTHQTLSMPNQPVDIMDLGSTGCALIAYALGGNLFTYNGVKNPLSGVSSSGTQAMTTSAVDIITLPDDSIGVIMFIPSSSSGTQLQFFPYTTIEGQLYIPSNPISPGPNIVLLGISTSLILTARLSNLSTLQNYLWKTIYWPI